jgi:deoxyribose-phosphate aldolase
VEEEEEDMVEEAVTVAATEVDMVVAMAAVKVSYFKENHTILSYFRLQRIRQQKVGAFNNIRMLNYFHDV